MRGLLRQHRHWEGFPAALAAALGPGHRVVCLDLPGAGDLHRVVAPRQVRGLVESLRRQARRTGLTGPLHLVGLSLGAMACLEWASAWPAEVATVAVMNPSSGGLSPPWRRLRPGVLVPLLRTARASATARERTILDLTSSACPDRPAMAARWAAHARAAPIAPGNAVRQVLAARSFRLPATPPPGVRGLVLRGLGDGFVHPACSAAIAARWAWPLESHPTAGHDLTLDAGPWVIDRMLRLVGR